MSARTLAGLLVSTVLAALSLGSEPGARLRVAVLPCTNIETSFRKLHPLFEYLESRTGFEMKLVVPADLPEFETLTRNLRGARTESVRKYLDGEWTREEASAFLQKYALMTEARADMYLRFGEKYRSYVVTYVVGLQLVKDYIEREAGDDTARRWKLMRELYAEPHLPSDLQYLELR